MSTAGCTQFRKYNEIYGNICINSWQKDKPRLRVGEFENTDIMQLTGHKKAQSLNEYSSVTAKKQRSMSNVLTNIESKNPRQLSLNQIIQVTWTLWMTSLLMIWTVYCYQLKISKKYQLLSNTVNLTNQSRIIRQTQCVR